MSHKESSVKWELGTETGSSHYAIDENSMQATTPLVYSSLSHDECVFMRKTGYEVLSDFLMIIIALFFGRDARPPPRRPELAGHVT